MGFSPCFLGSFGSTRWPHTKLQVSSRPQPNAYRQCRPSLAKRRRILVSCSQKQEHPEGQPSHLEDELKDILTVSMQDAKNDVKIVQDTDRQLMDGITETGVKEIKDIAEGVKGDLDQMQRTVEENATKLIEEETQAALDKHDQKRQELLGNLKKDREIISNELERITELAQTVKNNQALDKATTFREKAYFVMSSIFTVSALYFAWNGLTNSDSAALMNAAINAVVAAACTFAFSLERRRK